MLTRIRSLFQDLSVEEDQNRNSVNEGGILLVWLDLDLTYVIAVHAQSVELDGERWTGRRLG